MFRLLILIFCMSVNYLSADIQDHFKKISHLDEGFLDQKRLNKIKRHSMRNIDFIYTINLDQRPEKFTHCVKELKPYGVHPFRFSAVNGWDLSLEAINDLGIKYDPSKMDGGKWGTCYLMDGNFHPHHEIVHTPGRTYFCHCMARGTIGIVLSHLSVLQDALEAGYETIWVMEDDIQVIRNPRKLSKLIDKLDALVGQKGWDVLFTDQDTKNGEGKYVPCRSYAWRPNFTPHNPDRFLINQQVSFDFKKIGARYGAYSMIIRRSGMKKILNFIKHYRIFLPYDMDFYLPPDIHLYSVTDDVVSTLPKALSDNGAPNYKKKAP